MAICRVYVFTYKRNHLLTRAINSLTNQTFTDWVCEVHNDDPADEFPEKFIKSLKDDRFIVRNHPVNLGAVKSFNLAFAGCDEAYASILEDDNWWEPAFLEEMIALLNAQPAMNVGWSNMHLWEEKANNEWEKLNQTIWSAEDKVTAFTWPANQQAMAALHSNSSHLYRGDHANNYRIPENALFNAVELIRERSFEHPLYLNNKPLANFSKTLITNRTDDPYTWIATQVMMLGSFVQTADNKAQKFKESLTFYRQQKPSPVVNFFLANIFLLKERRLYKLFTLDDWLKTAKWLLRNGHKLFYIKKYLLSQTNTYNFLLRNTRMRYQESAKNSTH